MNSSANEEETEEALTAALFSVQGNVDEVSMIGQVMKANQ